MRTRSVISFSIYSIRHGEAKITDKEGISQVGRVVGAEPDDSTHPVKSIKK